MNKLIATSILFLVTAGAQAEAVKYTNADGSAASEICIAALESRSAARTKAAELGLDRFSFDALSCNNMPATQWVASQAKLASEAPEAYTVSAGNSSPETELCVAAATSQEKFEELKARYADVVKKPEDKLLCNGTTLKRFVMKYSADSQTASL